MNVFKTYIICVLTSFCALSLSGVNTASNDSVKTTQLEEVVVKGDNEWITNGKAVFLPTRQAKRLAKNMEKMIEIMNTPLLRVNEGVITTSSGEPVSIYINGLPADQLDKSTFWANNVLSVEFYPTTEDPRFHSQRNVVNFIMKEYVAGGLTRLEGDQIFPNEGDYAVSSKLVFKKMTYNVSARGGYSRDHSNHSEASESFDNIWYENAFYDLVTREDLHSAISRNNNFKTEANARYQTKNFATTHGIAFDWSQNPNSGDFGSVMYSPTSYLRDN